jgi:hypothetical protein
MVEVAIVGCVVVWLPEMGRCPGTLGGLKLHVVRNGDAERGKATDDPVRAHPGNLTRYGTLG